MNEQGAFLRIGRMTKLFAPTQSCIGDYVNALQDGDDYDRISQLRKVYLS